MTAGGVMEPLTQREREVAALLIGGATNAEIATALWLSVNTVKSHMKRILRKTGASNRAGAVAVLQARPVERDTLLAPFRALADSAPYRRECRFVVRGGVRVLVDVEELRRALAEAEAVA